jgi:diguanylate cyclase (GGDEF)-like protein
MKIGTKLLFSMTALAVLLSLTVLSSTLLELNDRLIIIAAIILCSSVGAAIVLSRTIAKPIARLRKTVAEARKGVLDARAHITSPDEVKDLSAAFDALLLELKDLREKLRTTATVDFLTGAFNRSKIEQVLQGEIERASRYQSSLSLILFDLDNFKSVNDTYGHLSGDYVLKTVIKIIQNHIRTTDSLGRWGGEEFMLVAPETDLDQAEALAEKIRKHVRLFGYENVGTITISCGLTEFEPEDTIDSLIKRADDAMYRAKRKGRDRVEAGERCMPA